MLDVVILPCLSDNYAYLIREPKSGATGIVDPSEAAPVQKALAARGWTLTHILNTHHHFDHTGGNLDLKAATGARVYGPAADSHRILGFDEGLAEGAPLAFGRLAFQILSIPAHTSGHVALWCPEAEVVFTGDTLFAMGCGRLFEGTPDDMFAAMAKLAALPDTTRVYCGHEYTESNGRFALTVEPNNTALTARMAEVRAQRARGEFTMPSTIAAERATNPFMRARSALELGARRAAKDVFR